MSDDLLESQRSLTLRTCNLPDGGEFRGVFRGYVEFFCDFAGWNFKGKEQVGGGWPRKDDQPLVPYYPSPSHFFDLSDGEVGN